jgi:hypothetical protein
MEMPSNDEEVKPPVDQHPVVEAPKTEEGDVSVEQGIESPIDIVNTAPSDKGEGAILKKENDLLRAEEIRQSIISTIDSRRERWRLIPRESRNEGVSVASKSAQPSGLFARAAKQIKSLIEGKKDQSGDESVVSQFERDVNKYHRINFNYQVGAGVEGWTTHEKSILANGFFDCSALTFQKDNFVSALHLSPNLIRDPFEGGELVQDYDYKSHIASALRGILSGGDTRKTSSGDKLSEKEIRILQELLDSNKIKVTMLMGEQQCAFDILTKISSGLDPVLPTIKPEVYSVEGFGGKAGYSVYVDPENLYVIGGNNKVIKKGANFPDQMYDYQKV